MTPVYQTILDKGHGNCMQATIASIFDLPLDEVPNFIELGCEWFNIMGKMYIDRGYDLSCFSTQRNIQLVKDVLQVDKGVNGYWCATVASIFFGGSVTHSVIIDKDLNVVHDPNSNNKGHIYKVEDIISIDVCGKSQWYIDIDDNLIIK